MRKDLKSMAKMMGKLSVAKKEGKLPTYEASYTDAVATKWKDKGGKASYIKAAKAYNQKKYGTTNPSEDSSKAKITRAELASKKAASDKAAAAKAAKAAKDAKAAKVEKAEKADLASRTNVKKDTKRKKKVEVVSKDGTTVTKTKTKYNKEGNVRKSKIKVKKA